MVDRSLEFKLLEYMLKPETRKPTKESVVCYAILRET